MAELIRQPSTATLEATLASLSPQERATAAGLALEGELHRRGRRFDAAVAALDAALSAVVQQASVVDGDGDQPSCAADAVVVRHSLALAHLQAGRGAAGRAVLDDILALDPADPIARFQLAVSLESDGFASEALRHYEQQVATHPGHVAAWHNLGLLRLARGDRHGAVEALARTVAREPAHFNAWMALGRALHASGRPREAVDAWSRAHALRANDAEPLGRAAAALGELAELPGAIELLRRAIALAPGDPDLRVARAAHLSSLGQHAAALAELRGAREIAPDDARLHSAVLVELHYGGEPIDTQALAEEHWAWGRAHADALPRVETASLSTLHAQRRPKLRIGYVSPRFGLGPLATLFLPVLEHHDRERFEIHLFASAPGTDAVADRMRKATSRWHDLPADDVDAARMVAEADLDLVVDLAGHSPGHRLAVLARRPARVQATWLDYFDTTGVAAIDYLVGDAIETPPSEAARFRERLVLLPCRFGYRPLDVPATSASPAQGNGHITFGSFNRHAKIGDDVLACWAAVLEAVPRSRLRLRASAYRGASTIEWLRTQWLRRIPLERVDFAPWLPWKEALASYAEIDIALDPFPYNGGATTCDALAHGVPVVTLAGDRMISRQSAALLHAAGHPDWIAADAAAYVRIATRLADPDAIAGVRARLQREIPDSPLCDVKGFARNLERAFERMVALGPRDPAAPHPLPPLVP